MSYKIGFIPELFNFNFLVDSIKIRSLWYRNELLVSLFLTS